MKRLHYSWTIVITLIIAAAPASAAIIAGGNHVHVRAQLDADSGPASGIDTIITDPSPDGAKQNPGTTRGFNNGPGFHFVSSGLPLNWGGSCLLLEK